MSIAVPPALPAAPSRLARLFDDGTAQQIGEAGGGVVSAWGDVAGMRTLAFATDATPGSDGYAAIAATIDRAVLERAPVIGLWHAGGVRIAEGVTALDALGRMFGAAVGASGLIPQISVVLGQAVGAVAYGPPLADVVVMAQHGRMFVSGPPAVRAVTGERVDAARLGGAEAHARRSGAAHVTTADDDSAIAAAREIALLLGRPGCLRPAEAGVVDLAQHLPEQPSRAYDVRPLVRALLDRPGVELQPRWAPNIVTTLGRLAGRTVGVVANNPLRLGGCLDAAAAEKAARFVRTCDSLGIALVVLVDVPGYLPGVGQEWDGVVRRGAKLLHAFADAVVPRVTVVTRKAYGGAYIAMNSRCLGATAVYAWPGADIAAMGAAAAVTILHRKRLAAAPASEREELRARLTREQACRAGGVRRAVEIGVVDAVVAPAETRLRIAEALAAAPVRRGRHTNIPL